MGEDLCDGLRIDAEGDEGEGRGPLWPLAALEIERSEAERLDLKDGGGLGVSFEEAIPWETSMEDEVASGSFG